MLRSCLRQERKVGRRERTRGVNDFNNYGLCEIGRVSENDVNIVVVLLACQLHDCGRLVHPELLRKRSIVRQIRTVRRECVQSRDCGGNDVPKIDASRIGISQRLDGPSFNATHGSRSW